MAKMASETRVSEAAEFIAAELRRSFDRMDMHSHVSTIVRAAPAYKAGLTNYERQLAVLRALASVQIEITKDLADMLDGGEDPDDDTIEEQAAEEAERRYNDEKSRGARPKPLYPV